MIDLSSLADSGFDDFSALPVNYFAILLSLVLASFEPLIEQKAVVLPDGEVVSTFAMILKGKWQHAGIAKLVCILLSISVSQRGVRMIDGFRKTAYFMFVHQLVQAVIHA
jgi:hypothetical protein